MALTDINSEDRLVQQTFAVHLKKVVGWESVYAYVHGRPDLEIGSAAQWEEYRREVEQARVPLE